MPGSGGPNGVAVGGVTDGIELAPKQTSVGHPGGAVPGWFGVMPGGKNDGIWLATSVEPKFTSCICDIGSVVGKPRTLSGNPGPSPSGPLSRWASPTGGTGPATGGRSTGTTPVAYAAAQPSTLRA